MANFRNFNGQLPIPQGAFGNGQPTTSLNTAMEYSTWVKANLDTPFDPATTWSPPTLLMAIDTNPGGIFHFLPSISSDAASLYEYRTKSSTDTDYSAWTNCTSFRLQLPNKTFDANGVQVRKKASTKLASNPVVNKAAFQYYAYPIYITNYYFTGRVFHVIFDINQPEHIRFRNHNTPEPFLPGMYDIGKNYEVTFDYGPYPGQYQKIQLENGAGYLTPPIEVVVPTTSDPNAVTPSVSPNI